jgi:hypothetical protein
MWEPTPRESDLILKNLGAAGETYSEQSVMSVPASTPVSSVIQCRVANRLHMKYNKHP